MAKNQKRIARSNVNLISSVKNAFNRRDSLNRRLNNLYYNAPTEYKKIQDKLDDLSMLHSKFKWVFLQEPLDKTPYQFQKSENYLNDLYTKIIRITEDLEKSLQKVEMQLKNMATPKSPDLSKENLKDKSKKFKILLSEFEQNNKLTEDASKKEEPSNKGSPEL
jgi:hypothetical protein